MAGKSRGEAGRGEIRVARCRCRVRATVWVRYWSEKVSRAGDGADAVRLEGDGERAGGVRVEGVAAGVDDGKSLLGICAAMRVRG